MKNKKVLIIGPSWLGDMIMAQPLLKILKKQSCSIDVLAPEWSLPILQCMPNEVNKVIPMPIPHGRLSLLARYHLGKKLRDKYDQAIILPNSWKSALIPFWAKIPIRTGWIGECRWGLLNDIRKLKEDIYPKMIQRYAALGYPKHTPITELNIPDPALEVSPQLVDAIEIRFNLHLNSLDNPILAICPGAAFGQAKRWPIEYFAKVAQRKIQQGWEVWLFGSNQDHDIASEIHDLLGNDSDECINFTGKLILPETVTLLSKANAVISNDSGLMHVAAALGIQVIGIFGSTSPSFTPPAGKKAVVVYNNLECSPCKQRTCPLGHHKCMQDIKPEQILSLLENAHFNS